MVMESVFLCVKFVNEESVCCGLCFRTITYLNTLDEADFYFLGENISVDVSLAFLSFSFFLSCIVF
jgi:hypothetical protein